MIPNLENQDLRSEHDRNRILCAVLPLMIESPFGQHQEIPQESVFSLPFSVMSTHRLETCTSSAYILE